MWGLVSFGAYLLFKLGWGVYMFNDVPEAHKELMNDINMAREELKAKGIDVDRLVKKIQLYCIAPPPISNLDA